MDKKIQKQPLKDPFRPKRPRSSFINFYLNSKDAILRSNRWLNLLKHSSMVKIASEWWHDPNLHENERDEAKLQARQDLEHYKELMERYQPPTQEELRRRLKEKPKRFRTNWNFYVQDNFRLAYKKFPNFGQVASYLASKWRKLSEDAKIKYNAMHIEDRLRYEEEMKAFIAKYTVF